MYNLDPYQVKFIEDIGIACSQNKSVLAQLATGGGKCLAKDTPIIMYNGTKKMSQDIVVGDVLLGPDSKPRNVISICKGEEMLYDIIPTNGDTYRVNESHILSLRFSAPFKRYKAGQTTNISVFNYLQTTKEFKHLAKGFRSDCVEFKQTKKPEIDPYFIGMWLGDGNSKNSSITTGDTEVIEYLKEFAEKNDLHLRIDPNSTGSVIVNLPENIHKGRAGSMFGNFLDFYKIKNNKRIPYHYRISSEEERLQLLAGLIDSDGSLHNGCYDITLKNEQLFDDMIFVAQSLGFAAYKTECKKSSQNGTEGTYFRCNISGNINRIPVKIPRKKYGERQQIKNVLNVGIEVKPVGVGEYFGFEIDGDKRFLLGDFTVTHNTVIFATIAYRFLQKTEKDVIIFVDSDKILHQTRKTLLNWYGIDSDIINADTAHIKRNSIFGQPRVFVAMVETFDRRSRRSSFLNQVKDVGLVIVDECHMGNFIKIFDHFLFSLRIGFTATPVSSDKKKPLRFYYDKIVCGPKTSELIEFNRQFPGRGVVRDVSYCLTSNINRKEIEAEELALGYKGNDFNDNFVGEKLSGKIQVNNTIEAYVKHAAGKKALCFNQNVKHSLKVTEDMCKYGLNARHIDADCSDALKTETYKWFEETPNAILCNVGMTTKGFDVPSVEVVILNRLTKSKTLFNQMCGRAVRPYIYPDGSYKEYGIILDMCDNILGGGHGQWSDDVDWQDLFENPKLPKQGVAPSKVCPECDGICSAGARVCKNPVEDFFTGNGDMMECGYQFEIKEKEYDELEREMILVSQGVDVSKIINFPKFAGKKDYYTFYETVRACAWVFSQEAKSKVLERDDFEKVWHGTYHKIIEWQTIKGRQGEGGKKIRDSKWFLENGRNSLLQYLKDYGFIIELI